MKYAAKLRPFRSANRPTKYAGPSQKTAKARRRKTTCITSIAASITQPSYILERSTSGCESESERASHGDHRHHRLERSPDGGKGLARDTRVRWALEEVGKPYEVRLVSFRAKKEPSTAVDVAALAGELGIYSGSPPAVLVSH